MYKHFHASLSLKKNIDIFTNSDGFRVRSNSFQYNKSVIFQFTKTRVRKKSHRMLANEQSSEVHQTVVKMSFTIIII